jgi:hypothetical protein
VKRINVVMALACAGSMAACSGHRSLTRDFGKANGAWRERQRVNKGEVSEPVSGLDSQEAAIIAKAYRRSLDPKGEKTDRQQPQVMILQEDERGRMQAKPLAPSVPKE